MILLVFSKSFISSWPDHTIQGPCPVTKDFTTPGPATKVYIIDSELPNLRNVKDKLPRLEVLGQLATLKS